MLLIKGENKKLHIYFEQSDNELFEYTEVVSNLAGMVDDRSYMNKKEAMIFSVKELDLRILWEF